MDEDFGDGESEALFCSPLSEPVDTVVLEASSPTLYQDALDMLAIPAMSAECERVFSSAKEDDHCRAQPTCGGHH